MFLGSAYRLNHHRCLGSILQFKRGAHRNHYDSLGLTVKATQGEIKKAYYKMSMKFHPDKPEGNEVKFREITAAYEVLSDVKLRRLYDRGIFGNASTGFEEVYRPEDRPHDSRVKPKSYTPATGKTSAYDFDEWSRMHYSKTAAKDFKKKQAGKQQVRDKEHQREKVDDRAFLFVLMLIFLMAIPYCSWRDYDKPSPKKPPDS